MIYNELLYNLVAISFSIVICYIAFIELHLITLDITDEQKNIEYKEATERIYTSFIIESSPLEVTMVFSYDSRFVS